VEDALDLKADLDSPALTGTPTAPTPAVDDDSEKIATTEFVVDYVPVRIGMVIEYDGTELPPRFLWANGAAVSRSTYAAYFAVVGTRFGAGNGSTTFNVRDKRGRIGVGRDNMGGVSAAGRVTSAGSGIDGTTLGASGGSENVTLDLTQIPAHVHDVSANQDAHAHSIPFSLGLSASTGAGTRGVNPDIPGITGSTDPAIAVSETSKGGGAAHTNMPPCDVTNFIVYVGV
jgi:microcystin-dependent protein